MASRPIYADPSVGEPEPYSAIHRYPENPADVTAGSVAEWRDIAERTAALAAPLRGKVVVLTTQQRELTARLDAPNVRARERGEIRTELEDVERDLLALGNYELVIARADNSAATFEMLCGQYKTLLDEARRPNQFPKAEWERSHTMSALLNLAGPPELYPSPGGKR